MKAEFVRGRRVYNLVINVYASKFEPNKNEITEKITTEKEFQRIVDEAMKNNKEYRKAILDIFAFFAIEARKNNYNHPFYHGEVRNKKTGTIAPASLLRDVYGYADSFTYN